MATIKLTRALRSQIYQRARRHVSGASPLFEVGYREREGGNGYTTTENSRLWAEDADLCDLTRLANVKTLELDAAGKCELDLYAYTGLGHRRQLDTNVYVLLDANGVLDTCCVGSEPKIALDPERAKLWDWSAEDVAQWQKVLDDTRAWHARMMRADLWTAGREIPDEKEG